jgi:hypothetical protein
MNTTATLILLFQMLGLVAPGPGTPHSAGSVSDTAFVTGVTLGTVRYDYDGCVGMQVTIGGSPGTSITATGLGRWVFSGNSESHTLHIRDASNTVLGSCTVNTSGAPAGQFLYCPLGPPVILNALAIYNVLSSEVSGAGHDHWYDSDTMIYHTTVASENTAVFSPGGTTGTCPGGVSTYRGPGYAFGPTDFKYH